MHHDVILMSLLFLVKSHDVKDEFFVFSHERMNVASDTRELSHCYDLDWRTPVVREMDILMR